MTTDPNPTARQPAFKRKDGNDMIPIGLIRGMGALALASLALVTFAVMTDRPTVAQPPSGPVAQEWSLVLQGGGAQAVRVLDTEGALIADLAHGGFVTVVQNGLERARSMRGLSPELPLRIVQYETGHLAAIDDHTPYRVELGAFGPDNKAAFERLLALQ